jgi:hypothetical protein
MNWLRVTTSTPGEFASTTKVVICVRGLPSTSFGGVWAATMSRPARVPLEHQSFSPLSRKAAPSSVGTALVVMRAGSEPTPPSVSANAEISPAATRGRNFRFCSSVPKSISGCATPTDWWIERCAKVFVQWLAISWQARQ